MSERKGARVLLTDRADITAAQQEILRKVHNTTDLSQIPQVWAMYKEVMGYFADGMAVPDDGEPSKSVPWIGSRMP